MKLADDAPPEDEDDWRRDGHDWCGRRVARPFPGSGLAFGRITRWMPKQDGDDPMDGGAAPSPSPARKMRRHNDDDDDVEEEEEEEEATGKTALFHVLHEDGDQEDLDEEEAEAAIKACTDEKLSREVGRQTWENKEAPRRDRIGVNQLGLSGVRREVLALHEQLSQKGSSSWRGWPRGGEEGWLRDVSRAATASELAYTLLTLEEVVYGLQVGDDVPECKPWRTVGHEHVGRMARRFFPGYPPSDGKIVGWLPRDGDDPALWHMVHQDDEEDLEEGEVVFAISNYAEGRTAVSADEEASEAYKQTIAQIYEANGEDGEEGGDDSSDEDEEKGGGGRGKKGGKKGSKGEQLLWATAEWRERWSEALQEARTPAMVGLALAALRQRCAVFGLLFDEEPPRAAELELQNSSWYHAGAFLRFKKHTKRGPPAGRRGGEK